MYLDIFSVFIKDIFLGLQNASRERKSQNQDVEDTVHLIPLMKTVASKPIHQPIRLYSLCKEQVHVIYNIINLYLEETVLIRKKITLMIHKIN